MGDRSRVNAGGCTWDFFGLLLQLYCGRMLKYNMYPNGNDVVPCSGEEG